VSEDLYYKRPRHEDYELNRLIHGLQEDDTLFNTFMEDGRAFVDTYEVDDDAKRLMTTYDYKGLVARGIHPMLVVQLQRRIEWNLSMAVTRTEG
jgi:hypothetical protein